MVSSTVLLAALCCFTLSVSNATVVSKSTTHLPTSSRLAVPLNQPRSANTLINALIGTYENFRYSGSAKNNWHYVTISKVDSTTLRWTNRAGVKWTLTLKPNADGYDAQALSVGTDCPYYKPGHTQATIKWTTDNNAVTALLGPWNEPYTKVYTASEVVQSVVGSYENLKYSGSGKNNWHYVQITKVDDTTLKWSNRAGVSWTLKLKQKDSGYDPLSLSVGTDSPYYKNGHTEAKIVRDGKNNAVTAVLGPWNEAYTRVYTAAEVVEGLVGNYENFQYSGNGKNNWHFVTISKVDSTTLKWSNRAGVAWTLKVKAAAHGYDGRTFSVESDSPYYKNGHTSGVMVWNGEHTGCVAVTGPGNEVYSRV